MMPAPSIQQTLQQLRTTMHERCKTAIGIPCNLAADYSDVLTVLADVFLNNIGDVFIERKRSFSTQYYERQVLEFFALLYGLDEDEWWGYITPGSTEGNLSGLWLARERFPQAPLYYSADGHYSLNKIARLLCMDSHVIPSQPHGEMDYVQFDQLLKQQSNQTAIINLNIGTTMKGAIDNLETVLTILRNNQIEDYHIHCDAALFGGFLPFLDNKPTLDFSLPIDSLAISGYKFIGSPFPCGIMLTRKNLTEFIKQNVEYICSLDTTLSGSRNGHAPMVLWHALNTRGHAGLQQEARTCVHNAQQFYQRLTDLPYPCFLNDYSNIIVLQKPAEHLVEKWRLISEGDWSHIIVMQHVTETKFNAFFDELKKEC